MKSRYSFVVLVLMCMVTAGISVFFTIQETTSNDHKFCDVINSFTVGGVHKPADPKADPSREKNYEEGVKFLILGKRLGC
jgi:hypothetical protein